MMKAKPIDVELMFSLFEYRPDLGGSCLVWKVDRISGKGAIIYKAGELAGGINVDGYYTVSTGYTGYKAHRVIWAIVKGEDPVCDMDHINGDRSDNRIENLRLAPRNQFDNRQNFPMPANNTSGYVGVSLHRATNKWRATISVDKVYYSLGLFFTKEEAYDAYLKTKAELHTFSPIQR